MEIKIYENYILIITILSSITVIFQEGGLGFGRQFLPPVSG